MNELLIIFVILLPVAWYMGYRNGRKTQDKQDTSRHSELSQKYFRGLNFLLNEQDDKAIDAFVSVLEVDSETVETHLALGNLYRKRGEVDRAIRLHQNLIARPSLSSAYRKLALSELGYDYMAAGLLDRAEHIFKELTLDQSHKQKSLKQLLQIYQQMKDWQNAINVSEKIRKKDFPGINKTIAHFYCELAETCLYAESSKEAMHHIKNALSIDSTCVRAVLIAGNVHYVMGRYRRALKAYKDLLSTDLELLPEAINNIRASYAQLGDQKGFINFLERAIEAGAGVSIILTYAEELQKSQGDRAAATFIAEKMADHPSIKSLEKLIELHVKHASENAKPSLIMLREVVGKLLENKPNYHCNQCGFDSKTLFWQCPSCKTWGSVKPIQGIEGE